MITRIERNFCRETSEVKVTSSCLLHEMAYRRAQRTFKMLYNIIELKQQNKIESGGLITCEELVQALRFEPELFQKFMPTNLTLADVIYNVGTEQTIRISLNARESFLDFRNKIHAKLHNEYNDPLYQLYKNQQNCIRFPGRVQVYDTTNRLVEVLPSYQKLTKKKDKKEPRQDSPGVGRRQTYDRRQVEDEMGRKPESKKYRNRHARFDLRAREDELQSRGDEHKTEERRIEQRRMQERRNEDKRSDDIRKYQERVRLMRQFSKDPKFNVKYGEIIKK